MFVYEVVEGRYARISWNCPKINSLSAETLTEFMRWVEKALQDPAIEGLIITSEKKEFIAGADVESLYTLMEKKDAQAIYQASWAVQEAFLRLETGGKPVVAAIGGSALGGGLELALACHYRIAWDDSSVQLGLPEVRLGLMPGAGGTQRLPRKIGLPTALEIILQGKILSPREAHNLQIVEALVPTREALLPTALAYLADKPSARNPWQEKGFQIADGPQTPQGRRIFAVAVGRTHAQAGNHYPHLRHALSAIYEGVQLPFLLALQVESQYFAQTLIQPSALHMVRTLFFGINRLKRSIQSTLPRKIVVLGAGMMGRAIGYVCACAGIPTYVKDTSAEALAAAQKFTDGLFEKAVRQGIFSTDKAQQLRACLHYTLSYEALAGSDWVIEAVIEDREIKKQVYEEIVPYLAPDAVIASNTSTLPITSLAAYVPFPERFVGMHFFSPAEKMQLVEIIRGQKTDVETLQRTQYLTQKIGKIPVVVGDGRGFFTSRVFAMYVREGLHMLKEGIPPALIENVARHAGMPVGPLALADQVSLELMYHIALQTQADTGVADPIVLEMGALFVDKLGRKGRKTQAGFYEYPSEGEKYLWPALRDLFPPASQVPEEAILRDRFLYVQAAEAWRVFQEGILTDTQAGDVASILGWGFAPYTGGVFSFKEYVGENVFYQRMQQLKSLYGERFDVTLL
ncbi:MAG: 3-hydroxyacyl-CoA dehydrogenase NAD-binding domain-containing protein [Bacteroidia bacterium]